MPLAFRSAPPTNKFSTGVDADVDNYAYKSEIDPVTYLISKVRQPSPYTRNIFTLMTGTGLAQMAPILASPLLTRLYGPADFGIYALYVAIVSIVSVAVTGRYEMAVLLPRRDRDALHIVVLSAVLSFGVSAASLLLLLVFDLMRVRWNGLPSVPSWAYWIPAATLMTGLFQCLTYWHTRKAQYAALAMSRVAQSGTAAVAQLGQGIAGLSAVGLIAGQLVGQVVSVATLARSLRARQRCLLGRLSICRVIVLARKYVDFPKYLILGHGLNTAASQMPVMVLTALFGATTAGFYMLTQRVMAAPVALVAGAAADVFRQEASEAYVRSGNCSAIYKRTFVRLLAVALPSCLIFFFLAPSLFAAIFGARWRVAGVYAQTLTPVLLFNFVVSPLSSMFMIAERQKLDLYWQVSFFFVVGAALMAGRWFGGAMTSLIAFSAAYSVMFLISGLISYRLSFGAEAGLQAP